MKINGLKVKAQFYHMRVPEAQVDMKDKLKGRPHTVESYQRGRTEWMPFGRGGSTACQLYTEDEHKIKNYIASGFSTCSMSDNFNYRIGRWIAIRRAIQNLRHTLQPTSV